MTYGHGILADFLFTHYREQRHPVERYVADSLSEGFITGINGSANFGIFKQFANFFRIIRILFADWQYLNLIGGKPYGKMSGGMFEHHGGESLD